MKSKLVAIFGILILAGVVSIAIAGPKICLDPGHGGSAPGAVGYITEKVHNLDSGLKLRAWMNLDTQDTAGGYDWTVIMTRTTDVDVSLQGRCDYANNNNAARFISIHANACDGVMNGSETFCYTSGSSSSFAMRNLLQNELLSHGGRLNRGNKVANFYVLKYTSMPAALTEAAFCDHYADAQCLLSSTWRNNVALGFLHALQRHYGKSAYTPSDHVTKIVDNANSGFSASSNWYVGTSNPDKYGSSVHWRSTEAIGDAANWNVSLPSSGTYAVYAWWTVGGNRSKTAPYIVYYSGGSSVINKNQQANGGKWNYLTAKSMGSGSNNVKLSCWTTAGYVVIADAIKWYK